MIKAFNKRRFNLLLMCAAVATLSIASSPKARATATDADPCSGKEGLDAAMCNSVYHYGSEEKAADDAMVKQKKESDEKAAKEAAKDKTDEDAKAAKEKEAAGTAAPSASCDAAPMQYYPTYSDGKVGVKDGQDLRGKPLKSWEEDDLGDIDSYLKGQKGKILGAYPHCAGKKDPDPDCCDKEVQEKQVPCQSAVASYQQLSDDCDHKKSNVRKFYAAAEGVQSDQKDETAAKSGGPCSNADSMGGYSAASCETAHASVEAGQAVDQLTQQYNSMQVQAAGQQANQNAMAQNTIAATYKAEAATADATGNAYDTQSKVQTYTAIALGAVGANAIVAGATLGKQHVEAGNLDTDKSVRRDSAKGELYAQGAMALLAGAKFGGEAFLSAKAAENAHNMANTDNSLANQYGGTDAKPDGTNIDPLASDPGSDGNGGHTGFSSLGSGFGGNQDSQGATDDQKTKDDPGLGGPVATGNGPNGPAGPAPADGGFTKGDPNAGAGAGGGSAGGLGAGDTSEAATDNSDPQAQLADKSKADGTVETGSGIATGGGGHGGGGGGGGIDLSSLLGQLLPTQKDADQGPKNGILSYGNRHPASEGPISLLDKSANIFQSIHDAYQDKNRRGLVGM